MDTQNIKISECDADTFAEKLNDVRRYWDGEMGHGLVPSLRAPGVDPSVILIREDGWSVCCEPENFESMEKLWAGDWSHLIVRDNAAGRIS